jgi:uncharacterized membrane protein
MISGETERAIEDFIKKTSRLLPDNFAAEDLITDLRSHIYEALNSKIRSNPDENQSSLIQEVLDDVGTPEEIAEEYAIERVHEPEQAGSTGRVRYYAIRLVAALIVVILAAWIVSIITNGEVDFSLAVVVLMVFAVIEWFVRAKQIGKT